MRTHHLWTGCVAFLFAAALVILPPHAHAGPETIAPASAEGPGASANTEGLPLTPLATPVPVKLVTRDGQSIQGDATAFSPDLAVVRLGTGDELRVPWRSLFPSMVFQTYRQLMDVKDARRWLELGRLLRTLPDGSEVSDSALQVAEMLDPQLAPDAAEARKLTVQALPHAGPETLAPASAEGPAAAPTTINPLNPEAPDTAAFTWGNTTPLAQNLYIAEAKAFAEHVAQKLDTRFTAIETKYFLYYTNLPPGAVYQSPLILDQMYDKACDLYKIPRGANIFKGKCIVFMFATNDQFKQYVAHFGGHDWAAGFCQSASTGEVRIVMFQGEDRGYTTQTMLHETTHGVNWRYRRPMVMPPWIEEGVAEWVASNTTGNFRYVNAKKRIGIDHLRQSRQLGPALFDGGIQETWQYGVSYDLVNTLIGRDPDKFVGFINAIKDGQPWEWALQEHYGWTIPQFLEKYGRAIGVPDLKQ